MREQQLLSRLVGALERSGVPYLLTGSFASSLQGYPRAVENLDLVARLEASGLRELKETFPPPEFELDEETALRAIGQGESFALLDWPAAAGSTSGRPATPPSTGPFARRYSEEFQACACRFPRRRTILSKLYWGSRTGSGESRPRTPWGSTSCSTAAWTAYLERWAAELGVAAELSRLEKEAQPLG
jgi:hypothetical protein